MGESVVGGRSVAWPEMGRWARIWLTVYVAVAVVDLIAETAHLFWVALAALILALPALGAVLVTSRPRDRLRHWVLAALFFGWLGDWLGDLLVPHIAWKIGFFLLGHVCFLVAFWPYRSRSVLDRPGLLACYALGITALLAWAVPSAGWLYGSALVAYGLTLGFMAVLATGLGADGHGRRHRLHHLGHVHRHHQLRLPRTARARRAVDHEHLPGGPAAPGARRHRRPRPTGPYRLLGDRRDHERNRPAVQPSH